MAYPFKVYFLSQPEEEFPDYAEKVTSTPPLYVRQAGVQHGAVVRPPLSTIAKFICLCAEVKRTPCQHGLVWSGLAL